MKKLLNKRGTVLFLVVVVMALLLVAASATYYVVRNQHASAVTHYGSEQSYQTAYSVSKAVSDFIDSRVNDIASGKSSLGDQGNELINAMVGTPTGSYVSDIDLTELGMGEATVTIKNYKNASEPDSEQSVIIYEITTTAEVNGETTRLVQYKQITYGFDPKDYFTRFLTSTGGRQEDAIISSHTLLSDAYFENDYTILGSGTMKVNDSLYCTGTLTDRGIAYDQTNPPAEIVVLNNFYTESMGSGQVFAKKIYVGGDYSSGKSLGDCVEEVYVLGDYEAASVGSSAATTFYIGGDCIIREQVPNATYYVNGDLYLYEENNNGTFYVNGDIHIYIPYASSRVKGIQYGGVIAEDSTYDVDVGTTIKYVAEPSLFTEEKVSATRNYIGSSTSRQFYGPWNAEQYYLQYADPGGKNIITLDDDTLDEVTRLGDNEYAASGWRVRIDKSCTIVPAKNVAHKSSYTNEWTGEVFEYYTDGWRWSEGANGNYIVIDASKEDIYIRLAPDIDEDGNVVKGTFSFVPSTYTNQYGGVEQNSGSVNVLIKGKYSVIFILPDGVSFDMDDQSFIGHYDLAMALLQKTGMGNATVEQEEAFFSSIGKSIRPNLPGSDAVTALMKGFLNTDDEATLNITAINNAIGYTSDVHNNVFLVTTGSDNSLTFNPSTTFCGYLYAPNAILDASNPGGGGLAFIGGLIVGSYRYQCAQAVLCFTTPYDYYNGQGTDIVKNLMAKAPGYTGGGGGGGGGTALQGVLNLGYQ